MEIFVGFCMRPRLSPFFRLAGFLERDEMGFFCCFKPNLSLTIFCFIAAERPFLAFRFVRFVTGYNCGFRG